MNSDYKDRQPFKSSSVLRSFQFAFRGIRKAVYSERNLKIHLFITVIVIMISILLKLSAGEWLLILFAIGGVIALELMNTAIERVVDLATNNKYHPLAQQAKDVAAGAVMVYAILSIITGLVILLPKILSLLR